ncbi:hypothetical protein OHA70_17835 [Kribbella sp. NBC_00382]|uniref:hypothetical protein n=1 Tax=Kribbella sp. NBC_00382 TaxID=2975967 RepID=UPI002E248774
MALADPKSPVNTFFDEHLPHHEPFIRPWLKTLLRRPRGNPMPASPAPNIIGAAIEFRIGFDLAKSFPYAALAGDISLTAGIDAFRSLGYEPSTGSGELSMWQKVASDNDRDTSNDHDQQFAATRLCWQMAYLESIAYELPKTELNTPENLTAFWTHLRTEPSSEAVQVLLELWRRYLGPARSTLTGFGDPIAIRPTFANRFAAGDLLLGRTLIEVKCELRPENSLPRTLRQVLACALADSDDELSIESIGVYHAYEGSIVHWPLARALASLSATGHASLPELRARFADTVATERRSIEERRR